jgi:hypothetical protein
MIMKGEKFFHRAFYPCFIYNRCKSACQEQADFPPVLTVSELLFTPNVIYLRNFLVKKGF